MTIEEMSQAKRQAEDRIRGELQRLQERTGMQLTHVQLRFVDVTSIGSQRREVVCDVSIELRVP